MESTRVDGKNDESFGLNGNIATYSIIIQIEQNISAHVHLHYTCYVGRNIVRKQFAILDELDNYSFSFIPGFDDNDIYQCENMI